jgi:hypothetical protein
MPIGDTFDPTGAFQLINSAFNAKNFENGADGAVNIKDLVIYWNTVANTIVAVDKDMKIVYELGGGDGTKVFRALLTSDLSPETVAMTVLQNTISGTVNITRTGDGKYNLEFGTELSPTPLPVGRTQMTQSGTFSGVFIESLGGDILGAGTVRYKRLDDFNVFLNTFFIGSPSQDGILDEHAVVIVVVP